MPELSRFPNVKLLRVEGDSNADEVVGEDDDGHDRQAEDMGDFECFHMVPLQECNHGT